jgi:hypothetical protein
MDLSIFDPRHFGINLTRKEFAEQMADEFGEVYRGHWTIDELLLHPREAVQFCDDIRRRYRYFDLPDDIILRSITTRGKDT